MRIYQVADVHLGRRRLDGRLPDADFAAAFQFVADAAVAGRADVFLIVGDLFDRAQVEPAHLLQAQAVLRRLRDAGVVVVAVEGNHDRLSLHSTGHTWVQFLGEEGLLRLLRPRFDAGGAVLEPWDAAAGRGAFLDVDGIRFVGAGYLGAATPAKVRQIVARLDVDRRNVLLLHAGPEYFVGEGGGFSKDDLRDLAGAVCYLALGHIHRPMTYGDWACNPGSLEHCELREAAGAGPGGAPPVRGYAVVEIDAGRERPASIEIRGVPRRPVHRVEVDCTPFGNKTKHGVEALVQAAVAGVRACDATPESAIDLRLVGRLNLNRVALDQAVAADQIAAGAGVMAVAIDTTRLNVGPGVACGGSGDADVPRDELERRAIRRLVDDEPLWGLDGDREEVARLFYELKEAVREAKSADEMAETIAASPLVESIRRAAAASVGAAVAGADQEAEAGS